MSDTGPDPKDIVRNNQRTWPRAAYLQGREIIMNKQELHVELSVTVEKSGEARGSSSAGEVVYWVIRNGLTDTVTFKERPEEVRAGAKGYSGRGKSTYFQETPERPMPLGGGMNSSSGRKEEAGTKR